MSRFHRSGNPYKRTAPCLCALLIAVSGCWAPPPPPQVQNQEAQNEPTDQRTDQSLDIPEAPVENPIRPVENDIPDPPQAPLSGDLDADGALGDGDLEAFRGSFGSANGEDDFNPAADLDGDGAVTLVDFQMLIDLVAPRG